VIEMMTRQGFCPVISPIGLGDDAESIRDSDTRIRPSAAKTVALRVPKLIYVTDVAGL